MNTTPRPRSRGVSEIFIQRPVATTTLMLALVLFGIFAFRSLPVAELPNVDFPTINVSASLPGADPETMAATVATPLEREFTQIAGLDSMTSTSSTGSTRITLQFSLDRDIDAAAQDVQTAISQARRRLPDAMTQDPTLRKSNPADAPIMFISMSATTIPLSQLSDFAETRVADRISQISGVAQVDVFGSRKYAARLYVDPAKLSAQNVSLTQVADAVAGANSNQPSGTLYGSQRSYTVEADGQLRTAEAYNDVVVRWQDGAPLRLRDVGRAIDSIANDKQTTEFNGRPSVTVAVRRQPGTNTVEIAEAVRALLPELERQAPGDTRLFINSDRSHFISESIHEVELTLVLSIVLVVGIIYIFLRDNRATLIAALALPASLFGTFGFMQLLGFSLDNLSLMALTLSVGFVVDDAIVVLENIARHRERGTEAQQAASEGAAEIGFTVISMTLSLVAVFIPILFMGGLIGNLFREFSITVAIAILLSAVVSLTLTPMLCARWLRDTHGEPQSRFFQWTERGFERVLGFYARTLRWALAHHRTMLMIAVATMIATVGMFKLVRTGFIPTQDVGIIFASTQAPEGVTYEELLEMQREVARVVGENPNIAAVQSSAGQGSGGATGGNIGRLVIPLKPRDQREASADEVIAQLREAVKRVPLMQVFFQNPPAIRIGGFATSGNYQYVLQGDDFDALASASQLLQEKMADVPGIRDVNSDLQLNNPQIDVEINRERAAALRVDVADIQRTLYAAYGTQTISTIFTSTNQYDVILQVEPRQQEDINALRMLYVPSQDGTLVPLGALAEIVPGVGPVAIAHYQQLPAITLSFDLLDGVSLGSVAGPIEELAQTVLPATVSGSFAGTAATFQESLVDLPVLLLFSILVIYMVLAILYEHFVHPLTILTALPLAAIGALLALWVFDSELNVFSFVGLILLVGLVKKNGIIMIDFALERRREGASAHDAIFEACTVRFRPIMMTTLAAIFGVLPIALGYGAGAESRQPLGIAVVGGLLTSQLMTLYITPAFYLTMESLGRWRRQRQPASAS